MASVDNDLQDFNRFARDQLAKGSSAQSIDELFDRWRIENPPADDLLAIQASIRDVDSGERGKPIDQHIEEIRRKHRLS
jgi:hypothetical protein